MTGGKSVAVTLWLVVAGCNSEVEDAARHSTAAGAQACPAPALPSDDWSEVRLDSVPATLQLPRGYSEKHWEVSFGDRKMHTFKRGLFDSFTIEVREGPVLLDSAGYRPSENWVDYSRCGEEIGGRQALVQATRGSGTIFAGDMQWPNYAVFVTYSLGARRYVSLSGTSATRAGQDSLLAIARTVRLRSAD
jgi:hypothetical protein